MVTELFAFLTFYVKTAIFHFLYRTFLFTLNKHNFEKTTLRFKKKFINLFNINIFSMPNRLSIYTSYSELSMDRMQFGYLIISSLVTLTQSG